MKKVFLFATGLLVGACLVINELLSERLIVNNNLDGSVVLRRGTQTLVQKSNNKDESNSESNSE